jgi:hypothetical protein
VALGAAAGGIRRQRAVAVILLEFGTGALAGRAGAGTFLALGHDPAARDL